ncbi:GNAT family N-acetyltransferase [Brevibacillus dissolubilis]|uniref:GNAT family N-acetyltransferase n=1 Tax=Brevibacillus dissolubilis TaxID=1844116 RepID=UPI0011166B12|nr:GNAT family N-acetyltransferase [Brevibacillus dissolubilis]
MSDQTKNGLIPKQGLSPEDLAEIKALRDICNTYEDLTIKLNWDMLSNRPADQTNDFLFYQDNQLIGFLGTYTFGRQEAEISGMVHPDYRRQGIFRQLTDAAREEYKRLGIPKFLFIVQSNSVGGKAFAESYGATYTFSEHRMKLTQDVPEFAKYDLDMRIATEEDLPILSRLNAIGFDMPEADGQDYAKDVMANAHDRTWIVSEDGQPLAKISAMVSEPGKGFIFGFCVDPDYRGRGYGRQILSKTIRDLIAEERTFIELEVACENARALTLYESCGFVVTKADDYYEIGV